MTVRATRALLGGAGVALLGFGVHGLLTDAQIHDPVDVALWGSARWCCTTACGCRPSASSARC
ncbi:hypothetical protein ACFQZC_04645 [Streptacidiphilus monticola]